MRTDTVVVGGGPAGLYAALRVARLGLTVRVLEEHDRVGQPVHCTGILGAEALALPGVPRDAVLGSAREARFHSPGGLEFAYVAPEGEAYIIDRGVFDLGLATAATRAGAIITLAARAVALEVDGEGVTVRALINGEARQVSARVCLLACGATYGLQRRLGWGVPPLFLSAAQTEVAAPSAKALEVFLRRDVGPAGFGWLAPITRAGRACAKVGVMATSGPRGALDRLLHDLASAGRIDGSAGPVVTRLLPLGPLGQTFGDRVLAIGDAAGLVKPTTGGGIYYSLLSASWAAETVALAAGRGDFSAPVLAAYEETWRTHLARELKVGVWFRRVAAQLTPEDLDALARLVITDGVMPVIRAAARFNWHRELILRTLKHPGVLQIVVRRLLAVRTS